MRFAYADPPYIGMADKYPEKREVNHRVLIEWLCADFDGWALSTHVPGLRTILPLCPPDVRICAWVKPFASFKPNNPLAYAWEPVLIRSCRDSSRFTSTVRDWVAVNIQLQAGFYGAKPADFCRWMFDAIGMRPEDEFEDVFPGSGAVMRAHEGWQQDHTRLLDLDGLFAGDVR